MIDRPRDDKGLFKPSGIKSFTGSRVCRRCNVVPACGKCNVIRGDYFTVEEMLTIIGPAVQKFRESNNK